MSNYENITMEYEVNGDIMKCVRNAQENIGGKNERWFLCQMTEPHQRFWYNPSSKQIDKAYQSNYMIVDVNIYS